MVAATPKTQSLINQICSLVDSGYSLRAMRPLIPTAHGFIESVAREYRETGKIPRAPEPVKPRAPKSVVFGRAVGATAEGGKCSNGTIDHAGIHQEELRQAEAEIAAREERKRRAITPVTGSAFIAPIPLSRLMGGRA